MESSICKHVTWQDTVYNAKKKNEDEIVKAKNTEIPERFFKNQNNKDYKKTEEYARYSSVLTLQKYEPRQTDIVIWPIPNKQKIMFRFWFDHFSWNVYEKEFTWETYYECLQEIGETIIKEYPVLYKNVNFVSLHENLRYWTYKHLYILSI